MLERAQEVTRHGKYTYLEYARVADDLVILVDAYPPHDWLRKAVDTRLGDEWATLDVESNEEKSGVVDLAKGESFARGVAAALHAEVAKAHGVAAQAQGPLPALPVPPGRPAFWGRFLRRQHREGLLSRVPYRCK